MRLMQRIVREEEGQAMILFVFLIAALIGIAAFVVDIGMVSNQKAVLQTAADAAALAGAQDLPDVATAEKTAIEYTKDNVLKKEQQTLVEAGVTFTPTPKDDPTSIEVVLTRAVPYTFARFLGSTEANITARAVARRAPLWDGEALPFVNLDDDYRVNLKIEVWEKTGPGDVESMWKDEYQMHNLGRNDDHSKGYFTIDYEDGITITKGTVATIKQEIGYIYKQHRPVYVFSLSSDVIRSGKYNNKLKNKDVIPLDDLVLLQGTFDKYNESDKTLFLTVTDVYDFHNGDLPTEYLNDHSRGTSSLIG